MRKNWESERHKSRRGRNLATLAALVGFIVLLYVISVVRMSGSWVS